MSALTERDSYLPGFDDGVSTTDECLDCTSHALEMAETGTCRGRPPRRSVQLLVTRPT